MQAHLCLVTFRPPSLSHTHSPADMDDSKKIDIQQDEYALPVSATDTPTPVLPTHPAYNPKGLDEKALVRKIDWRLIPWLSVLYLLSFLVSCPPPCHLSSLSSALDADCVSI